MKSSVIEEESIEDETLTGWYRMQREVKTLVSRISRRRLTNNTQRALFALLTANEEWVSRSSIRVPSVGARLRDLRKPQFGGFKVECASANRLERTEPTGRRTQNRTRQTFYRLNPNSITLAKVSKVFEGVVASS